MSILLDLPHGFPGPVWAALVLYISLAYTSSPRSAWGTLDNCPTFPRTSPGEEHSLCDEFCTLGAKRLHLSRLPQASLDVLLTYKTQRTQRRYPSREFTRINTNLYFISADSCQFVDSFLIGNRQSKIENRVSPWLLQYSSSVPPIKSVRRSLWRCSRRYCRVIRAANWQVESAGMWTQEGLPASTIAQQVMYEFRLDLSWHRTRCITADLLQHVDLVFTMKAEHKRTLAKTSIRL